MALLEIVNQLNSNQIRYLNLRILPAEKKWSVTPLQFVQALVKNESLTAVVIQWNREVGVNPVVDLAEVILALARHPTIDSVEIGFFDVRFHSFNETTKPLLQSRLDDAKCSADDFTGADPMRGYFLLVKYLLLSLAPQLKRFEIGCDETDVLPPSPFWSEVGVGLNKCTELESIEFFNCPPYKVRQHYDTSHIASVAHMKQLKEIRYTIENGGCNNLFEIAAKHCLQVRDLGVSVDGIDDSSLVGLAEMIARPALQRLHITHLPESSWPVARQHLLPALKIAATHVTDVSFSEYLPFNEMMRAFFSLPIKPPVAGGAAVMALQALQITISGPDDFAPLINAITARVVPSLMRLEIHNHWRKAEEANSPPDKTSWYIPLLKAMTKTPTAITELMPSFGLSDDSDTSTEYGKAFGDLLRSTSKTTIRQLRLDRLIHIPKEVINVLRDENRSLSTLISCEGVTTLPAPRGTLQPQHYIVEMLKVNKQLIFSDTEDSKTPINQLNIRIHASRVRWQYVCVLIAFVRANRAHPYYTSILPLLPSIMQHIPPLRDWGYLFARDEFINPPELQRVALAFADPFMSSRFFTSEAGIERRIAARTSKPARVKDSAAR